MQTCGSQKSLPPLVDPPPVSPALLSALKCLPPRSGCRSSSRAWHKGLLVGLQPGEGGGAPSLRVTHALVISFVRPAPARGCGRGLGFGVGSAGAPGNRRALSCGQGAPGTRGRPTRTASRRPRGSWIRCGGNVLSQPDFFRAQSKAAALGEACGPQQALLRRWSSPRARPCGKVKINHGREGLGSHRLPRDLGYLWSQLQSPISSCQKAVQGTYLQATSIQQLSKVMMPGYQPEQWIHTELMRDGLPGSPEVVIPSI